MTWSPFDAATDELADALAGRNAPAPGHFEPEPVFHLSPDEAEQAAALGYDVHAVLGPDELSYAEVGEAFTELVEAWQNGELTPEGEAFAAELAEELRAYHEAEDDAVEAVREAMHAYEQLDETTERLEAGGYDMREWEDVLEGNDFDVEAAELAMRHNGPVPKNLDDALDQAIRNARDLREAEHAD